ncbi:MAG TPA: electron-transfer flavoprotein:ubiquinone oxidoreductase [Gemmatimonadales bacterium]|nr:electron-transfer flavoprotein:ubiquinone oxidoreductase [Gemmatimonadales bacterium]
MIPAQYQLPLPLDRLIQDAGTVGGGDRMEVDALIVGAGPSGLAAAISLARLARERGRELAIAVLEKAGALGEHSLSGAVVNPAPFRALFPGLADREFPFRAPVSRERVHFLTSRHALPLPTPPPMRNRGNYVASLCEIVRWLGAEAERLGVTVLTGFPAASLLVREHQVVGVRTAPLGLDRAGAPGSAYQAPNDLTAPVTALAEGTRGLLAQAYFEWQRVPSANPETFALGVKELWEVPRPLDAVIHTLGWPLAPEEFGGSFLYPLEPGLIALGFVAGLDAPRANFDVHDLLQRLKLHPYVRPRLEGGTLVEWGAKTIPEGGYHALRARRSGAGVLVLGDAAGFVDVPSLKGIHYAVQSGIFAARAMFDALEARDVSAERLAEYDRLVDQSFIRGDLYARRNIRLAFTRGLYRGGLAASAMIATRGRFPGTRIAVGADAAVPRRADHDLPMVPDGVLTFGKLDGVFKSGNATRDTIPAHLLVPRDVPAALAQFYAHLCPAGVYEALADGLRVNPANCVDCKATDVLGPRWTPREGGSGPRYRRM